MRKTFTKLLLISFMLLAAAFQAKADHMVGSDIYWKCLGKDSFEITVVDYRDCNGIPFVNTPITITPVGNCPGVSAWSPGGSGSGGKDITPVCKKSCTRCTDLSCDFPYGIQQYFITFKVVLPKGCCDYQISWDQCCRSAGITTGGTWKGYYITSQMSRCTPGCDNSPYFTNPPVAIYCTNQCIIYNPGANDDDRDVNGEPDSLAYSLTEPLQPGPTPVPWTGSYNYKEPLDYAGFPGNPDGDFNPPKTCNGFHVDPITGEIKFKAVKTDVTLIALKVEEYRRDSLGIERKIGEIRRDMQILIIDCPDNHSPVVTGINGGNSTSAVFCADQQNCFSIKCFDQDPKDSVQLSWNNQIAGASFTVLDKTKKWPSAMFCWRPKKSDIRNAPYRFVVTGVDNACPVPGRTTRTFSITVVAPPEATYSATKQGCGVVFFQATPAANSNITDYVWVGEGSPGYGPLYIHSKQGTYQYTRAGWYHYTLVVTNSRGCSTSYPDSVKIDPFVFVSLPKDTTVCEKSLAINIQATYGLGNRPYKLWWDNSSVTADNINVKVIRDTNIVVHIKDANGCTNYDSMKVHYQLLPRPNLGPDQRGCWGHRLMLKTGIKHMPVASWTKIKGKDTTRNYMQGDTIYVADSGTYVVNVRDSFGCPGADTINIYFNPLVKATPLDTDVCFGDSVRINAGIAGADATFKWIDVVHQKVVGTGRTYTVPKATNTIGGYHFQVVINQTRYGVTCIDTAAKDIRVHNKPTPKLSALPDKCIDDNAFSLTNYVDVGHKGGYWYYPKNPSAVVSDYLYPSVMGLTKSDPTLGWVHYIYTDQYKCVSNDSVRINVTSLPQVTAGHDSEICTAAGRYILSNGYVSPSGGTWIAAPATTRSAATPKSAIQYSPFRDTVYFDPSQVPVDSVYAVIYKVTQASGKATCSNSDTVYIRVKTNPFITITKIDSLCDIAEAVQLSAQPGGGIWSFADATPPAALTYDANSQSYFFDPKKSGGGSHKLYYMAYGDPSRKMCSSVDSTNVYVIPSPAASFNTEDGAREYCQAHGPVKLVPNKNWPGGSFAGSISGMVYMTGGTGYFDPSKADLTDSTKNVITYFVPYDNGKCVKKITRTIGVDPVPSVHITTNPVLCVGQVPFHLSADVTNVADVSQVQWTIPNGQNPNNQQLNNGVATMDYYPTSQQLKSPGFWVYATATNYVGGKPGACAPAKDSVYVVISPLPNPVFAADDTIGCEPLKVSFINSTTAPATGVIITKYDWNFGDGSAHYTGTNPPPHFYSVSSGTNQQSFDVTLTATTNFGCSASLTKKSYIIANATPRPKIYANPQFTTIAMPDVQFDVDQVQSRNIDFKDPGTQYTWTFGDVPAETMTIKSPKHVYKDTGIYMARLAVQSLGCTGYDSLDIHVKPELIIYIPNVFKPNEKHGRGHGPGPNYFGPSENETFQPVISDFVNFEMMVYNRWGELMFRSTNPLEGWDGHYKGGDAQEGVYVYVIKATSFSGRPYTFTGSVTMVR